MKPSLLLFATVLGSIAATETDPFSRAFSPCTAAPFIDGLSYYADLVAKIDNATSYVLVSGWDVTPGIIVDTPGNRSLVEVLGAAVNRGVAVHVLVWHSSNLFVKHNLYYPSHLKESVATMTSAGVHVLEDAGAIWTPLWQQHQKAVVVDSIAYVGGIDLAYGRLDSSAHALDDSLRWEPNRANWSEFTEYMPWHDSMIRLEGDAVKDVEANFKLRWDAVCMRELPLLRQHACSAPHWRLIPTPPLSNAPTECRVALSLGPWSANVEVDTSAFAEYARVIREARRFVYIENQYFSSFPWAINNFSTVVYERIVAAIDSRTNFTVVVLVPAAPNFEAWIYSLQDTIFLRDNSLFPRLKSFVASRLASATSPEDQNYFQSLDLSDFLSFYYPENRLIYTQEHETWAFSQSIYVHSKLLIADDDVAIIGSANICDRSFLGTRDSEIIVVTRPSPSGRTPCSIEGTDSECGVFAHALRRQLFGEHLDMDMDDPNLADPVDAFRRLWRPAAELNSAVTAKVFGTDMETMNLTIASFNEMVTAGVRKTISPTQLAALRSMQGRVHMYPIDAWGSYPSKVEVKSDKNKVLAASFK